jgi:hypothetical protein
VDSDDDEYQKCDWWTGEHDDDYRSPYDNTPLKDMPCVEEVEPNHLQAPHTRGDRDKFAFDRLHNGNELEGIRLLPEEMVGRTVLMPPTDNGERFRATIKERFDKHNATCETHPEKVKFRCVVDGKYKEIVSYNQIIDLLRRTITGTEFGNSGRSCHTNRS